MPNSQIEAALAELFEQWTGRRPELMLPLAPSASPRIYYRLTAGDRTAVGAYNLDRKENEAFLQFSRHFHGKGLPVPEIYAEDLDRSVYLLEDLGFTTLYSYLLQAKGTFPDHLVQLYRKVVTQLVRLQVEGGQGLDYGVCYPRSDFDMQSMRWDFNTFKYYFLKLSGATFDEQALEDDMHRFAEYLLSTDCSHFMFRDFQTRNIMIRSGEPYFIDYQGGRRGALQYDLASLLYPAKADIPHDIRQQLVGHYLDALEKLIPVDRTKFIEYFHGYVLMRSIQTFGTYGYRGLFERKEHFLQSIPFALRNVEWILENAQFPVELPELTRCLREVTQSKRFQPFDRSLGEGSLLTVSVKSFSYLRGIPQEQTGHGGGFVFDCRSIHNPGRYEPYKRLTGRDEPVMNFLNQHSHMPDFLNHVRLIVAPAVENYIERSFTDLSVYFGCTGGQHRSVYAADQLTKYLREKYGVRVKLEHVEQERKGWEN